MATKKTDPYKAAREKFFERTGQSIAGWADKNGFGRSLVYAVLNGKKKCIRGESHKIAVLLGIKEGTIVEETRQ